MIRRLLCLCIGLGTLCFAQGHAKALDEMFLVFDHKILRLDFTAQKDLLETHHQHYWVLGDRKFPLSLKGQLIPEVPGVGKIETAFTTTISPLALRNFLEEAALLKQHDARPVEIYWSKQGEVTFEGKPKGGYRINYESLVQLMNRAIAKETDYVRVPARTIYSDVVVHPELRDRGIQEIIAVGESNFAGSSSSRLQNIMAASEKFNGQVVPRGKYFSFNEILEDVTEEDGFVKELVIKGNKTEKELGGGICQVSTTAFRAAVNGGFPIKNRRNHSYAVPYYKPFGLDAAIYLGVSDMRFKNDTPGDMLLQTFVDGNNLHFVFYGTKDDRKVSLEGPFISDIKEAPDPIVLESEDLPEGEMKVISEAHAGFQAEWVRRIEKGGETIQEVIVSQYRPWPARVEQGVAYNNRQ